MLLYLIHKRNPDKTQYDINEVQGELKYKLAEMLLKEESEEDKTNLIFNYITTNLVTSPIELMQFCIEANLLKYLRQNQLIFREILKENTKYKKELKNKKEKVVNIYEYKGL